MRQPAGAVQRVEGLMDARISTGIAFFEPGFRANYSLGVYGGRGPVAQFGMYFMEDYMFVLSRKDPVVVMWCGNDARRTTMFPFMFDKLLAFGDARHVAGSPQVAGELAKVGITAEVVPFTPSLHMAGPALPLDPRHAYHYGSRDDYNRGVAEEACKLAGIPLVVADHGTYGPADLLEVYRGTLMGLRLTEHDGLPTTVVDLGLLGRRSVFNGDLPHVAKWTDAKSVAMALEMEAGDPVDPEVVRAGWLEFLGDARGRLGF